MNEIERELQHLEERFSAGELSSREYSREVAELEREYRYAAEESAQRAYDDERNRW